MALALADVGCADEMRKVAPRMAEQIREAISAQRGRKGVSCPEALQVPCCCCRCTVSDKTAQGIILPECDLPVAGVQVASATQDLKLFQKGAKKAWDKY